MNETFIAGRHDAPVDAISVFGPQRDTLFIVLPITIIYVSIFFVGLIGNVFTCTVIFRDKSMHTATNYYLFSLAISDLLLLISGMPQEIYSIWSKWPYVFGHAFCVIRGLAAETSTNASIVTITLFTVERYLAICHPFQSHKMSKLPRAKKQILVAWAVSLGLALPQALQFGLKSYKGVTMCLQTRVIIEHSFELSTFVFFLAPMALISVLYSLIGLRLNKTSRERIRADFGNGEVQHLGRKHSKSTKRVIKMLGAVVLAFFICWAPFHAQRLVAIYGTTNNHLPRSRTLWHVYNVVTYISGIFYYMSTCINPILYNIMSNKFRAAFKNTLLRGCLQGKPETQYSNHRSSFGFDRVPTVNGLASSRHNNSRSKDAVETSFIRVNVKNTESKEIEQVKESDLDSDPENQRKIEDELDIQPHDNNDQRN